MRAFVNTWFEKVLKIQRSHRLDWHASYEFTDPPTSFVERRRIWQAILRLFSYADSFQHNPRGCTDLNDFENGPHVFFSNVATWELEELECVYYLSKEQCRTLRGPAGFPALAMRSLERFQCDRDEWDRDDGQKHVLSTYKKDYESTCKAHFAYACGWDREILPVLRELDETEESQTQGIDTSEASHPNFGYQFMEENLGYDEWANKWGIRDPISHKVPLGCFLNRAHPIWDKSRLEAWQLIDNPSKQLKGRTEWWIGTRERQGLRECAHCPEPQEISHSRFILPNGTDPNRPRKTA